MARLATPAGAARSGRLALKPGGECMSPRDGGPLFGIHLFDPEAAPGHQRFRGRSARQVATLAVR